MRIILLTNTLTESEADELIRTMTVWRNYGFEKHIPEDNIMMFQSRKDVDREEVLKSLGTLSILVDAVRCEHITMTADEEKDMYAQYGFETADKYL